MQRREPVERRGLEAGQEGLDRLQDPVVRRRQPQPSGGLHRAAPGGQGGQRATADERIAAPALAALDRLEEEALPVADQIGEGGDRREGVGHDLAPHRDDGVLLGQGGELDGVRPEAQHRGARVRRERAGHSGRGTPGPWPMVR